MYSVMQACVCFLVLLCGFQPLLASRPVVYKDGIYLVTNATEVVYAQGQTCADEKRTPSTCKPMDLMMNVWLPDDGNSTPRPAVILVHGGGWRGGTDRDVPQVASANFFASRGFAVFNIAYRLAKNNGPFPEGWPVEGQSVVPEQAEAVYAATRDIKAAVRSVRAQAERFGVDPDRIALSGGSAGAISSIAVGAVFDDDYKSELSATDPTLPSTYINTSSKVQCVVSHWGAGYAIDAIEELDPKNQSRYVSPPPLLEIHGDQDRTVPFKDAQKVEAAYKKVGGVYEMHVLEGMGHSAWCAGCPDKQNKNGVCTDKRDHCDELDAFALPFLATHMDLSLE